MPVTLVPGNTRVIYTAVQSAQGTAATTPSRKLQLTADSLDPGRQLITLPETDSSTQQPNPAVVGAQPGGTFGVWMRPNAVDQLLYGLQMAKATSGSGNYTHTLTPTTTEKFLTVWDVVPGITTTKYVDCIVKAVTVSGQSGQGITGQFTVQALSALVGQAEPNTPAGFVADVAMTYPQVTVTRGGVHNGDVDAFSITIDRGGGYFFGDNGLSAAAYALGLYGVTGSATLAFGNDQEYRAFNTGATNGTNLTTTLYSQSLEFNIAIDTNTSFDFLTQGAIYTAFPIGIDTSGAPTTVAAAFQTKLQATWANNMTITVKNQNAAPDA